MDPREPTEDPLTLRERVILASVATVSAGSVVVAVTGWISGAFGR